MEPSHRTSHRTSHIRLPHVAHTIQRHGFYHYKKRVHSTFVQFSLKTADPALARYYTAIIDREVMDPEDDIRQQLQRVLNQKEALQEGRQEAGNTEPTDRYIALVNPPRTRRKKDFYKDSKAVIEVGPIRVDYGGDYQKEISALNALLQSNPELLNGISRGSNGGGTLPPTHKTLLIDSMQEFTEDKRLRKQVAETTLTNNKRYLKRYADYIDTKYVEDIDRQKHRVYITWLLEKSGIKAGTINQEVSVINEFAAFLRDRDIVDLPRIKSVTAKAIDADKVERLPFTQKHLPELIQILPYLSKQQRIAVALCFMTGARIGEIGQLECKDIREEDGVYYLDINNEVEDPDDPIEFRSKKKSVKNLSSKRQVPIPDCLLPTILDLHRKASTKRGTALFYDIKNNEDGGRGENVSRAFIYRLRQFGFNNQYVLHCARYMFKNLAHSDGCDEAYTEKVMGHASQKTGRKVYLKGELDAMRNIVNHVSDTYFAGFIAVLNSNQKRMTKSDKQ